MARDDRDAATLEMVADHRIEATHRQRVERGLRLVEQPDRAGRGEEPGQRELSFLSRGKNASRQVGERAQPESGKRLVEPRTGPAEEIGERRRGSPARSSSP